jgi:hypothetical protein
VLVMICGAALGGISVTMVATVSPSAAVRYRSSLLQQAVWAWASATSPG